MHFTHGLADLARSFAKMMTVADVAGSLNLTWETVKEMVKDGLEKKYAHIDLKGVRHIAIDEIHVGQERRGVGMKKKARYFTIVIDLDTGRIIHVGKGRSGQALIKFFRRLRRARIHIEAVSCDMAAGYWAAILKHLPGAKLVFDRFHIVKLMNERIQDMRRALQREADVLGRAFLKGTHYLLLMRGDRVPENRREQLEKALKFNEPLSVAYYLKERLLTIWDCLTRGLMRIELEEWVADALASGLTPMIRMASTLRTHLEQIINYADHPITSGKLEGINNKIKTLNRQAYGYRDDDFFTLKLYDLHTSKYKLI